MVWTGDWCWVDSRDALALSTQLILMKIFWDIVINESPLCVKEMQIMEILIFIIFKLKFGG